MHYDSFNRQKTATVTIEALGHGFYGSVAKLSLQKTAKIIQKFTVRPKGGAVASSPPPHNTAWHRQRDGDVTYGCSDNLMVQHSPFDWQSLFQFCKTVSINNYFLAAPGRSSTCRIPAKYTPCPEKKDRQYFGRNFDKFTQLLIIFGLNHPDNPCDWKIVKCPINTCTTLCNDDVIVASLKNAVFRSVFGKIRTLVIILANSNI